MTWLEALNFYALQWLFIRLARVIDDETGKQTGWTILRVWPRSGWAGRPYRYWALRKPYGLHPELESAALTGRAVRINGLYPPLMLLWPKPISEMALANLRSSFALALQTGGPFLIEAPAKVFQLQNARWERIE
jgi:hypothetical protein